MCLMSLHATDHRRRPSVVLAVLLLMLDSSLRGSASTNTRRRTYHHPTRVDDAAALQQLTRVFGIGHVSDYYSQRRRHTDDDDGDSRGEIAPRPAVRHHRSAPEYMLQLYDAVAYHDGISKTAAPYEADVVRGIPDRGRHTIIK